MPEEPILLTPQGKAKLEAELAELLQKRPELVEQMASSREDRGELAEDAAYVDTMNRQAMVEGRIQVGRGGVSVDTGLQLSSIARRCPER